MAEFTCPECGWCEDITRPESLSADKVLATAQYQSLRIEASRLRAELAAARAELESVQAQAAAMRKALVSALHEVRLHSEEYHHVTDALTKGFIEASIEGAAGRELQEELKRLRARVAELEEGLLPSLHALEAGYLDIGAMQIPENPMVLVPRADWDASPQWRDRPAGPGWWVWCGGGEVELHEYQQSDIANVMECSNVSYFGPIPAPEDKP